MGRPVPIPEDDRGPAPTPWSRLKPAESEAVRVRRIATALASRHDLRVIGFDSPGIDERTTREIATAIDHVLTKYPSIDLRGVGIAELHSGELSRAVWDWQDGPGSEPVRAGILLSREAAANRGRLVETVRAITRLGLIPPGSDGRPAYAMTLLELGRALDVTGGFRARGGAQRALIAAYLRTRDPEHRDRLAVVVAGYRAWRGQLRGRGMEIDRLDAGEALASAFADVELNRHNAPGPAAALHRLLVETARGPTAPVDVVAAPTPVEQRRPPKPTPWSHLPRAVAAPQPVAQPTNLVDVIVDDDGIVTEVRLAEEALHNTAAALSATITDAVRRATLAAKQHPTTDDHHDGPEPAAEPPRRRLNRLRAWHARIFG